VPLCTGSHADDFVLSLNGAAVELVNFGTGGGGTVYRPRTDQSFLEAVRKPDDTWDVFDRSGMRYTFGTTSESRRKRSATCTTVWGLTQIQDPNDNTIELTYLTGKKTLALDAVEYGGDPGAHAFTVSFEYEAHPIPTTSWRNGSEEVVENLVSKIHVAVNAGSYQARTYDLVYDDDYGSEPPNGCSAPDRALLCEVSVSDGMPTQRFEYASAAITLGAETSVQPLPVAHLRSATENADVEDSVMDMNGDSRLDFVNASDTSAKKWTVYYGAPNGGVGIAGEWCANGGTIDHAKLRRETDFENGYAWTQKETIDLTGDGLPDFVDATNTPWLVYPGVLSMTCPNVGTRPGFLETPIEWAGAPAPFSTLTQKEHEQNVGDWVYTWKRLVDMNADGRPDLLIADQATGEWTAYLNTGTSFSGTVSYGVVGAISEELKEDAAQTGAKRRTKRDLFDFNGDGLPDVVESASGNFLVYLNDGDSFTPLPEIGAVGDDAVRLVDNSSNETWADFVDANGDGLPDRVRVAGTTWHVSANRGTTLAAEQSWGAIASSIRESNSKGNSKIDVLDWNHDGLLDRVNAKAGGGVRYASLPAGPTIQPYLMTAAHNGLGGSFYPTYQPSTRFQNTVLPFVTWVVTAVRRTDGLCTGTPSACLASGNEIQRTYAYKDGDFDAATREFRGFGWVQETFPEYSPSASSGSRTVTFSQADHTRGQILTDEIRAVSISPLLRRETYTWATQADGNRTQVYLAEKKTEEFAVDVTGVPPVCRIDRNSPPDPYGRVASRATLPCDASVTASCSGGDPVGTVTTLSPWADPSPDPAPGQWGVRERPASVTVSYVTPGCTNKEVSAQGFTYDWPRGNVLTATTTGDATTGGNATVTTAYDYMSAGSEEYGNLTSVTDARGGQSTSVYSGTPFSLYPSSETNAVDQTVQTQWDLRHGKETQVVGPNGEVTAASYDAAGRVSCEAKPGRSCPGAPSAVYSYVFANENSAPGWEGDLSYVEVRTSEPNNVNGPLPGLLVSRSYFDALGRERATATWRVVGAGDDLDWVVTKQVDYDLLGRVSRVYAPYETGPAGTGAVGLASTPASKFTQYLYDSEATDPTSRVRYVTTPDGETVETKYRGAWTHVIDQKGNQTSTKRDFLGREVQRLLYDGLTTLAMQYDFAYDGLDRLLSTTVGGSTTTQEWDALGRKRKVVDPDSGTWETRYDLSGNPILQDDPKSGQRVEACYDQLDRVVLQCAYASDATAPSMGCQGSPPAEPTCGSGTVVARYTYDVDPDDTAECGGAGAIGQLTSVVDTSGGECWAYDARGRVTTQKKTILHNGTPTTAKMDFAYDDADHLLWVRYPEQIVGHEDYTYQADGLPETLGNFVALAEYDLFGRLTKLTSYRNTEDTFTYDTAGTDNFRLQAIQTKQFSTEAVYLSLTYGHDERGKLEAVDDLRDAGTPLSNKAGYCYDGLGRLTKVDRDPAPGSTSCSAPDETFAHNDKGNLTAKNNTSFAFANPARPHQPTSFGVYTSIGYTSIGYDANGSRTLKDKGSGNKDELLYDARGLLVEVKRWTNGSVTSSQTNLYDYAGSRVVKAPSSGAGTTIRSYSPYADVGGGNLTKYFYFGGRMIGTYTVAAPAHLLTGDHDPELVVPPPRIELPPELLLPLAGAVLLLLVLPLGRRRGLGVRVGLARSASLSVVLLAASFPVVLLSGCPNDPVVRVYHTDHLGSAQVVTDWNGNIYRQIRYAAYGEIRGRFNSAGNPAGFAEDARFEFTGYETDFAGLDYAGARFFDPELAQFASHDPAGQYPSPYAYGPGDPVNGTDPGGELFLEVYVASIVIRAAVAFIDTKNQTGSTRAGISAAGHAAADAATFGIYSSVKAISNDEYGQYMADYYANRLTLGVYGAVQAFNNEQIAGGVVGAVAAAAAIVGLVRAIYSITSAPVVSGDNWQQYTMSYLSDLPPPHTGVGPLVFPGGEAIRIASMARFILRSGRAARLWRAYREGAEVTFQVRKLKITVKPEGSFSGFNMGNEILLGKEAFKSPTELTKTVLQELIRIHRRHVTKSSSALAPQEAPRM
jgi:RHS repeat-associated protein